MTKYRWLDDSRMVFYRPAKIKDCIGRRGEPATIFQLPVPGYIGNVGIEFSDGLRIVTPAGCLRHKGLGDHA